MKNKKSILLFGLAASLLLPLTALAFYSEAKEGVVVKEVIEDDAYLAGESIYVEEEIQGDAFLAAEKVVVNAPIGADGMVAGGEIEINAPVLDDLRLAGEKVHIEASIADDLIAMGSDIGLGNEVVVGGDALLMAENLSVEGVIEGDLKTLSPKLYLNAQVNGDVTLHYVEEVILGSNASITGDLTYTSFAKKSDLEAIVGGGADYKDAETQSVFSRRTIGNIALSTLVFSFLGALLIGIIFIAAFGHFGYQLTQMATKSPFKSMGFGFLLLFILPVVFSFLFATVIGIPLALVLLVGWLILIYLSKVFACLLIAGKLFKWKGKNHFGHQFLTFTLVLALYEGVSLLPILGFMNANGALVGFGSLITVAKLLVSLTAVGALMIYKGKVFKVLRKKKLI